MTSLVAIVALAMPALTTNARLTVTAVELTRISCAADVRIACMSIADNAATDAVTPTMVRLDVKTMYSELGALVGITDGDRVGPFVGTVLGLYVVGLIVGFTEGFLVGEKVGLNEGLVGELVGGLLGPVSDQIKYTL